MTAAVTALLNSVVASHLVPSRARLIAYKAAGIDIPLRARVSPGVTVRTTQLTVGRKSTINYRCLFDNRAPVTIGARVGIGADVHFITSGHETDDPACRAGDGFVRPITVGDGVWIGSRATILGGVTIGAGSIIAAGSVVNRDVPPHCLYGGTPAKLIRALTE